MIEQVPFRYLRHCGRHRGRSSGPPARGGVVLLLSARKRQPRPLQIVVILVTMRYGKIYFYDRLGNRVPFSADSVPRGKRSFFSATFIYISSPFTETRIKGHRLPDFRSDPFDVPNFRPPPDRFWAKSFEDQFGTEITQIH